MECNIVEKRRCTLCFWWLERRKLKPLIKDNAEVTPTDVYILRSRSVPRVYYALTHTFGCIVYIPSEGIKSVRSIKEASYGLSHGTGSMRYPRFFLHCGKTKNVETSDAWVSVRPFVTDRRPMSSKFFNN